MNIYGMYYLLYVMSFGGDSGHEIRSCHDATCVNAQIWDFNYGESTNFPYLAL